ncbi:MAG: hypothetical protein M3340_07795 [Actinomycetota bacterium]|nr:hypothetical protein [Actinomycetota bacterium]
MFVDEICTEPLDDGWRLVARVHSTSSLVAGQVEVVVRGGEPGWLATGGDPLLAALLLPAMALGEELVIEAPVSAMLYRSAFTAMEIYAAWWGDRYRRVPLRCGPAAAETRPRPPGVGLFFTAGVDSYFSLLKDCENGGRRGHEPVSHLLFANVNGYAGTGYERFVGQLRRVSEAAGRSLVLIDTNVRRMAESHVSWPDYHGAALAAVALSLSGLLGRCYIAGSDHYRHLPPLGSHPVLDHLWSTERFEFVHDGAEATRTDKIERLLANSRLALETLSVCWRSEPDGNCGTCEKCLRTMAALDLAGCLDRCSTLPPSLDLDALAEVELWSEEERDALASLAVDARTRRRHDVVAAIEAALQRWETREAERQPVSR